MKNRTGDSKLSHADRPPVLTLMDEWSTSEFDSSTPTTESPKPPPSGNAFWYVCGALLFVLFLIVNSAPTFEVVVERPQAPVVVPVEPGDPIAVPVEPRAERDPAEREVPAVPVPPAVVTPPAEAGPLVPGALNELVARLEPSVVYLFYERGGQTFSGTGFVLNGSGLIATNAHVVSYTDTPGVMTSRHQSFRGRVIARAANEDLALVQADLPADIQPMRLGDSDQIRLGDEILVMGFPVGLFSKVTVATGIVGSIRAEENRVQLSMAINPGNSGGPVFSRTTGEVVAVVVSKHARAEGMGFSIPVNTLKQFMAESGH